MKAPWSELNQCKVKFAESHPKTLFCNGWNDFFGLVIPAIAAAYSGVFFLENLKTKVGATYPDVILSWQNFKEQQERLRNAVKKIEYDIEYSEGPTSKIDELIKKKIEYVQELNQRAPINLQPYYLHIVSYFWPIIFFCISIVAFFAQPTHTNKKHLRIWIIIIVALLIYISFALPLFIRTKYATTLDQGRVVYAFSNPDISMPSFIAQNLNFFMLSLLLS
ncbi:MAG: hypothetical protein WCC90_02500, partial [Methylocella sp.]